MACGCGSPGCGGPPCTTPARARGFAIPTPALLRHSLARKLIGVADKVRNLNTIFGRRPYIVRLIYTRWSGGARFMGDEYVISDEVILPTPLPLDLAGVAEIITPIGADEQGQLLLTEVSGCYTEEQLRGLSNADGSPAAADQSFYYEIEFLRADSVPGERRRFTIAGAPEYLSDRFQWHVKLERSRPDRTRAGAPR